MNNETISGKFDQITGKIKQAVGEAIGNDKLANQGAADEIKGHAKETWGHVKDTASDVNDQARANSEVKSETYKERAEDTAHNMREKITSTAENLKNNISGKLDDIKDRAHRG